MAFRHSPFIFVVLYTQQKRRPRVAYLQFEAFALPKGSNKQQETYADMTTPRLEDTARAGNVIPIGIYCDFGF